MKIYHRIIFVLLALFMACQEKKKEVESVAETAIESAELDKYSDKFRRIAVTNDGVLRGFTFITDSAEIRRNETAQFLSSNPKEISYTLELNEFEMADIIYHLKGNEIDTFELDLYLRNKESTDSLLQDFKTFYTEKYGNYSNQGDSLLFWKDSVENVGTMVKYINRDVDHGINIYLYKSDEKQMVQ